MMNLSQIIKFYLPNSQFVVYGNTDLVWCDPNIQEPTQEQLDAWKLSYPHDIAKQDCKDKAKQLLSESDWSTLPDVQTQLLNYQDFINYRSQLRNLVINPVDNPVFPSEPEARWK